MPLVERSGRGYITGGVIDDTPDWLGSYNEGVQGAQQQTQNKLNIQGERQRQATLGNEEARRQTQFDWAAEDRARTEAAWADPTALSPTAAPQGPRLGVMDPIALPAPIAPPAGLMTEGVTNQPAPLSRQAFLDMLPEWAGYESQSGLPPGFLERTAFLESTNGTKFRDGSQYVGVFQVGPEVAADFGVTPEQLQDPRVNAQVAAKLAARNLRQLREGLGREPQPWELYLAHQQGAGGALALLRSPNQSAVDALAAAHGGDRTKAIKIITANGGNPQMTAGQFAQVWAEKYSGGVSGAPGVQEPGAPVEPKFNRMGYDMNQPLNGYGSQEQTSVTEGKSDIPAGLLNEPAPAAPPTQPAPAAPAAFPATTAGSPGLATPTSSGEVVPRITQEEVAGLKQPGQGSIASQIMRAPAGQQATLPDSGLYMVEPARIRSDKFELQQARKLLEQNYQEAIRFRDRESMVAIRSKAAEVDAALRLMDNLQAIASMQAGNDNMMAQQLSVLSNGQLRIQPITGGPQPMYNVYYGGKMIYENVTKEAFLGSLRSHYDQQYQAQVSEALKRQDAVDMEVLKSGLKTNENIQTRQADAYKEIAIKNFEAQVKQQYPNYNTQAAVDGSGQPILWVTPDNGGAPVMFAMEPVKDVYGNDMTEANGQVKMKPVRRDFSGNNTVPVQ